MSFTRVQLHLPSDLLSRIAIGAAFGASAGLAFHGGSKFFSGSRFSSNLMMGTLVGGIPSATFNDATSHANPFGQIVNTIFDGLGFAQSSSERDVAQTIASGMAGTIAVPSALYGLLTLNKAKLIKIAASTAVGATYWAFFAPVDSNRYTSSNKTERLVASNQAEAKEISFPIALLAREASNGIKLQSSEAFESPISDRSASRNARYNTVGFGASP